MIKLTDQGKRRTPTRSSKSSGVTRKKRRKKKNKLLNKFIRIFIVSFAILILATAVCTACYIFISKNSFANTNTKPGKNPNVEVPKEEKTKTTFAVFGVDRDGFRTDVTMLVFFDHKTLNMDIVSIPRDTRIDIPDDIYIDMKSKRRNAPKTIKINEVPSYSENSPEKRNETSVAVLEEIFDVDIDYYINIDLKGFKYIVDLIGGVEVYIPEDMYYNDPFQDLHINLKKGLRTLNGDRAEQLVRNRKSYANGDLGRIDMQHEFMIAFMEQLLKPKNKINMVNLSGTALMYVDTNFDKVVDYLDYLDKISVDKLSLTVLPGEDIFEGRSYFIYDEEKCRELFDKIINNKQLEEPSENQVEQNEEEEIDVKKLKISVQNGTNISGFAGNTMKALKEKGFNIIEATNYDSDTTISNTIIFAPTKKAGEEIGRNFKNPEIKVDKSKLSSNIEAIIVLGESDKQ
jgi:LCP family protein required for cell wall assembly